MARFARVVHPNHPHHLVHRGNRRQAVFFEEDDRATYAKLLRHYAARFGTRIWAYCLMPNHVHLIAVPAAPSSLAKTVGSTQWRYAQWLNRRLKRTGHLWENRYFSSPLDDVYIWAAVRYVERNPLRAGMVEVAETFRWSSARAHVRGIEDPLLDSERPFASSEFDWSAWLNDSADGLEADRIRSNSRTGRPTGSEEFVSGLEAALGRCLRPRRRGPRARDCDSSSDREAPEAATELIEA